MASYHLKLGLLYHSFGDHVDKVISRDAQVALTSSGYLNVSFGDLVFKDDLKMSLKIIRNTGTRVLE